MSQLLSSGAMLGFGTTKTACEMRVDSSLHAYERLSHTTFNLSAFSAISAVQLIPLSTLVSMSVGLAQRKPTN